MAFPDDTPVTPPRPGDAPPSAAEAAAGLAEAFGATGPADALDARGRAAVLYRIRMLMEFWGITPAELTDAGTPDAGAAPPAPAAALPPKVRHPVSGQTWDGQGPQPQWLRDALLKEGYTPQQLRDAVNAAGEAATDEG